MQSVPVYTLKIKRHIIGPCTVDTISHKNLLKFERPRSNRVSKFYCQSARTLGEMAVVRFDENVVDLI